MAQHRKDTDVLREAHAEAVRTAAWSGLLGCIGFGVALTTGASLAQSGSLLAPGFGLDAILLVCGAGGGIAFTAIALRASAMARRCREQLADRR